MNTAVQPVEEEKAPRKTCPTCAGTGLVCGHVPVIDSQNCCADFANALCPDCKGRGTVADA
jgi:DnaJ-class molecular chaperone